MAVILPLPNNSRLLTCGPYKTFVEKIRAIPHAERDGARIVISVPEDQSFCAGFLSDTGYCSPPSIAMQFRNLAAVGEKERWFVRLSCCWYIDEDEPLSVYTQASAAIREQSSLFYLPFTPLDVSVNVDGMFEVIFDALLPDNANLVQSGCLLLNQLVTMFTFMNKE